MRKGRITQSIPSFQGKQKSLMGFVACNGPILMINGLYILKTKNCGLQPKVVRLSICVYNLYIHNKMILKNI